MRALMIKDFNNNSKVVEKTYSYCMSIVLSFLFFAIICVSPCLAQEVLTSKNTKTQWVDDPFSAQKSSWLSLDGYEKKLVDDAFQRKAKAIEKQQGLIDAERISAHVRTMKAVPHPAVEGEDIVPINDVVETDVFAERAEREWMSVEDAKHEMELVKKAKSIQTMFGKDPHNIRFATLPDTSVKVSVGRKIITSRVQREKKIEQELARKQASKRVAEKKEKEVQACKAISDYRRKQLAAMESDRKTLSALREALSELGLSKELSFMSQAGGQNITVAPHKGLKATP